MRKYSRLTSSSLVLGIGDDTREGESGVDAGTDMRGSEVALLSDFRVVQ